MTRSGILAFLTAFFVIVAQIAAFSADIKAEGQSSADFKEVYDTLRAHLSGVSEAELNRAAVEGLVTSLGSKVKLLTNGAAQDGTNSSLLISGASVLESNIAY